MLEIDVENHSLVAGKEAVLTHTKMGFYHVAGLCNVEDFVAQFVLDKATENTNVQLPKEIFRALAESLKRKKKDDADT